MDRRLAIKQVMIMAGGLALLPSCLKGPAQASIELKHLKINADQENLLAEIAETIIPKTDTPGAKDLKLHLFVLKMADDCYDQKEQDLFCTGLEQFQDLVHSRFSKTFRELTLDQRNTLLTSLQNDTKASAELSTFYSIVKSRTIGGYLNSKYVMSNLLKWELVPGRYNGYFPVKSV